MYRWKAQFRSRTTHSKYESRPPQAHLSMVIQICRGYPWRRGPSLGPIVEGMDIIVLLEMHEHEVCKVLNFEGYMKM